MAIQHYALQYYFYTGDGTYDLSTIEMCEFQYGFVTVLCRMPCLLIIQVSCLGVYLGVLDILDSLSGPSFNSIAAAGLGSVADSEHWGMAGKKILHAEETYLLTFCVV